MISNELKPCPFCGGEAKIQVGEYTSFVDGYAVRCGNCSLTFGACGRIGETYCWSCCYETEAEAIEAWNTRAERTCHFRNDGHGILWCDAQGCDYEMDDYLPVPNYCPSCGAKVVE